MIIEKQSHACAICQKEDWQSLDQLRSKEYWFDRNVIYGEEIGFKVCKNCGFVTYTPRWTEDELKKRYSKGMRQATWQHMSAMNRKNAFHVNFLNAKLGKKREEEINVFDLGCSFGSVRGIFPKAKIQGIEYSAGLANMARRDNKIDLIDNVNELTDDSLDLIIIYHTLEHLTDPRGTLEILRAKLKADGILYIAVPDYLIDLREVSRKPCQDFEELYHLNHQNVFSIQSMKNLLHSTGFKITQEDNIVYGYATLSEKTDKPEDITLGNYQEISTILAMQKQAVELFVKVNTPGIQQDKIIEICETALGVYPRYLDPYLLLSMQKDYISDIKKNKQLFDRVLKVFGKNAFLSIHFALNVFFSWGDPRKDRELSNNTRMAENILLENLALDPGNAEILISLFRIAIYYRRDFKRAAQYVQPLVNLHPQTIPEVQDSIGYIMAQDKWPEEE